MRVIGYVLLAALGVLVLLLLAAVVRTLCMKKKTSDYTPHPDAAREREYAEKLSRMVAYETVSHPDDPELEKFRGFHKLLAELYPTVHEKLEKTGIDGNLLFFWEGKNHDRPLVLMSHQDVVPAEGTWEHAPFSGDIADGKVWGRGASDTKCSVMGFFQACEELLREGYVPEQDVYLSSSCTEEFAGPGGGKLVDELRRRGVKPFLVCDEGGASGCIPCWKSATRAAASSPSPSAAFMGISPCSACLKRERRMCVSRRAPTAAMRARRRKTRPWRSLRRLWTAWKSTRPSGKNSSRR